MTEQIVAEFDKCPACGSTKRFVEELANEVKAKGWMHPELNFVAYIIRGMVKQDSPEIEAKIPIGSIVPGYGIMLDVCLDCGCIYAVKLVRDEARKTLPLGPQMKIPPGSLKIKEN